MNAQLGALADDLERDLAVVQRELDEIAMLLKQTATEAERHEARRVQAEERLTALEGDPGTPLDAMVEARSQLLSQTRRATLMQSQIDVLTGKQRALQRYHDRMASSVPVLREAAGQPGDAAGGNKTGAPASGDVLAAQEQMRREIARQMHDGPAQSIANIALQAQIVQRLFERDPARAEHELSELVGMVQQALEATKSFIFDVRPMVLDDLGLVPTLRRSARERSRRSGTPVRFESVGADRRLSTELESGLFRIIDDAVVGYLSVQTIEVVLRLDWSENALRATVSGRPAGADQSAEAKARAVVAAARRDRAMPAALATMIHEQETSAAARNAGLPESVRAEIAQRAEPLGVQVLLSEDRWQIELTAERPG
jgi:two-component system sensor histidine kinase DegS